MVGGQSLGGPAPAGRHGGSAGQALETVAVKRARSRERIGAGVAGQAHVAHLGMDEAVHETAVHQPPPPMPVPTVR